MEKNWKDRGNWCIAEDGESIYRDEVWCIAVDGELKRRDEVFGIKKNMLAQPARNIHDNVVATIKAQLNELREEVEVKAKQPAKTMNNYNNPTQASPSILSEIWSTAWSAFYPNEKGDQSISAGIVKEKEMSQNQNKLISFLLKGDLESVKSLEKQGISFLLSDDNGMYPLVAAVYGVNFEVIEYVERRLQNEVLSQWIKVDANIAIEKINKAMPTQLYDQATYGELGNWYSKNAQMPWICLYDILCLQKMNCARWVVPEWGKRGYSGIELSQIHQIYNLEITEGNFPIEKPRLVRPSRSVHDPVVKIICEKLNNLRNEVEAKANKPSEKKYRF